MLQSISWQDFIGGLALVAVAYYIIAVLLLYSKEISATLKHKWDSSSAANKIHHHSSGQAGSLMGAIRPDHTDGVAREVTISMEEIMVSAPRLPDDPIEITSITVTIEDDVTNLASELDALIGIISHNDREECLPLFQSLVSRYASLVGTEHIEPLSKLIHEKVSTSCDYKFELDEIRSWWPPLPKQKKQ